MNVHERWCYNFALEKNKEVIDKFEDLTLRDIKLRLSNILFWLEKMKKGE